MNVRPLVPLAVVSSIFQFLSGRDEVFLVIDIATTVDVVPTTVGELALWGLYTAVFYLFLSEHAAELTDDRRLAAGVSVLAVAYAVVTARQFGWIRFGDPTATAAVEPAVRPDFVPEIAVVSLVASAGILAHTKATYGTAAFGTPLERLYRRVVSTGALEELRIARRRDGWVGTCGTAAATVAMLTVVLAGCFYLGSTTAVVAAFFPLFELLLVGTGLISLLTGNRTGKISPEDGLQRIAQGVFIDFKGLAVAPLFLIGAAWSLVPMFVGSVLGASAVQFLRDSVSVYFESGQHAVSVGDVAANVGLVGFGALPFVAGCLIIWYWWRLTRRLPAFLRRWRDPATDVTVTVARPPLVLLPAAALLLILAVPTASRTLWQLGYLDDWRWSGWLLALVWPACTVAAVYWVTRVRRIPPGSQSIGADRHHAPVALWVQVTAILVWAGIAGNDPWILDAALGRSFSVPAYVLQGGAGTAVLTGIALSPDIYRWARRTRRWYVKPGIVLTLAGTSVWLGVLGNSALAVSGGLFLVPFAAVEFVFAALGRPDSPSPFRT